MNVEKTLKRIKEIPQSCCICHETLDSGCPHVMLTLKGCNGINKASETRKDSIHVEKGQSVRLECRRRYCNPNVIASDKIDKETEVLRSLRSNNEAFSFKDHCLFCGQLARNCEKKRGHDVYLVRTFDFQSRILDICSSRKDTWGNDVRCRLEYAVDLPAVEAVYHQMCNVNFRTRKQIPITFATEHQKKCKHTPGRPKDQDANEAFDAVIDYLKQNDNEQITVTDLVDKMHEMCGDKAYSTTYIKQKLEEHFGESVIITEINGKTNVVTLKNTAVSILHDFYSRNKSNYPENEKMELLRTASKLIKSDIKSVRSSKNFYPGPADLESTETNLEYLPYSLKGFLRDLFSEKNVDTKVCAIGQAIMQATRPRVIITPLQLGLGVQLHHHFASKFLIDTLNSLGFCVSYSEVQMFEASAAVAQNTDISNHRPDTFMQYAADNVDHNVRTLDGHNTFHGMGMIACMTPGSVCNAVVPRRLTSNEELLAASKIDISYLKTTESSKPSVSFAELQSLRAVDKTWKLTFLAKTSWPIRVPGPEWSGFMQLVKKGEHPGKSSVVFLPMIDMDPTDMSCINTTLKYIDKHAAKYNQTPIITFDQPLYWKALMIILNENENSSLREIVLRLGGFHCIMSFLGCIGQLMSGSGLKELIETVYAPNAVTHIISGKAVARALRGHFLIDNAMHVFLLSRYFGVSIPVENNDEQPHDSASDCADVDIDGNNNNVFGGHVNMPGEQLVDSTESSEEGESINLENMQTHLHELAHLYNELVAGELSAENVYENKLIDICSDQIVKKKQFIVQYPTAALWVQYMEMVAILRKFLTAERTGNWELSLQSLYQMLPFFAAAGHNLYSKSVYFYIQSMQNLQQTNLDVHTAFQNGHHVIRRSDRYWAGLSTYLVIEQVLMRSVKTTGGMTRGKGMTELQRAQWLLSMPICAEINNAMQSFCGNEFHTSIQHKEMGPSRKNRDYKDAQTFLNFVVERNPFPEDALLCNIETGVTSDKSVNAHKAKKVGTKVLNSMVGQNIFEFSFKKKLKAVTLDTVPSLKCGDEIVKVDPQLLFQGLTAAAQRFVEDMPHVFSYELCSVPSAIFDNSGLIREPQKSLLADAIWALDDGHTTDLQDDTHYEHVLDGGSLIQRIPWTRGIQFSIICDSYVQHISSKYTDAVIVFDGYRSGPSTKDTAHIRRTHGVTGTKVYFTESTPFKSKKEKFLINSENKQNFILMLSEALTKKGYRVVHADGDADLLIVKTALALAERNDTVVIGEDTDIIVLLLYHAKPEHKHVYFKSDLKQRSSKGLRIWDILQTKRTLGQIMCRTLPVLHASTGCDTTSRLFGISKGAVLKKFQNEEQLHNLAEVFLNQSAANEVINSGEQLVVHYYGGLPIEGLDLLRFRKFSNRVMSSSTHIQVHTLPPTSAAAKYHSLRVYFQVQEWIDSGSALKPEEWGWSKYQDSLRPVKTDIPDAPENLLKMIRCKCRQSCDTKRCTCRRNGLECTTGCGDCKGISCTNGIRLTGTELSSDI